MQLLVLAALLTAIPNVSSTATSDAVSPAASDAASSPSQSLGPLLTEPQTVRVDGADYRFLVLTVATSENEALFRFEHSCAVYGHACRRLGFGKSWRGGNMKKGVGGGQKINLLRAALDGLVAGGQADTLVMFSDSYDVFMAAGPQAIAEAFVSYGVDVLFSAERWCWPERKLEARYPPCGSATWTGGVASGAAGEAAGEAAGGAACPYRFLNSGGFIGRAGVLRSLVGHKVHDHADDQLYFTHRYLASLEARADGHGSGVGGGGARGASAGIALAPTYELDTNCSIFQTLGGAKEDVEVVDGK